jgi:signal transduction histidine kinase
MEAGSRWSHPHLRQTIIVTTCVVVLALVEVTVDAITWIELDVAAVYGLPLVLAVSARSLRLLWTLAVTLIFATFLVYAVQIPIGAFATTETFFVNRIFDAVGLLLTAGLLHVWIRSRSTVEAQARLLAERNDELVRHKDKIALQNAELDIRRREAEEASARKTRLLAAASHDIRTPVNTINIMAEVIRRTAAEPALAAQVPMLLARLQESAQDLAALVSAILDSACFESGRVGYEESVFSLNKLIIDNSDAFLPVAQAKALELNIAIPEETLWVRTDRVKLNRVMSNLISNAIKFTATGAITVRAGAAEDGGLMLSVSDTGMGIDSRDLARIFDEFIQLDELNVSRPRGWGLGLGICRRLVTLMGGKLTVDSELHKGSLFSVWLPSGCLMPARAAPLTSQERLGRTIYECTSNIDVVGRKTAVIESRSETESTRDCAFEGSGSREPASPTPHTGLYCGERRYVDPRNKPCNWAGVSG